MADALDPDFKHDREAARYALRIGDQTAFVAYKPVLGGVAFTHTETPEALQGRGLASRLVKNALISARAEGLKVRPDCPYVAGWLARHPEFQDVVLEP